MQVPVGTNIDQIHIGPFANLFPVFGTGIRLGPGQTLCNKDLVGLVHVFRHHIAKRHHPDTFQESIPADRFRAAHSQADKGNAHRIQRLAPEFQYIFNPRLTGRLRKFE